MHLTANPSQKAHFVEACTFPKPKSKAGVGLFTLQFPARTRAQAQAYACLLITFLDEQ